MSQKWSKWYTGAEAHQADPENGATVEIRIPGIGVITRQVVKSDEYSSPTVKIEDGLICFRDQSNHLKPAPWAYRVLERTPEPEEGVYAYNSYGGPPTSRIVKFRDGGWRDANGYGVTEGDSQRCYRDFEAGALRRLVFAE